MPETELEGYRKERFGKDLVATNCSLCNSKTHFPAPYSRKRSTTTTKKKTDTSCDVLFVYMSQVGIPQSTEPTNFASYSGHLNIGHRNQMSPATRTKTHSEVSGFVESSEVPFYLNLPFCHIE